MTTHLSIYDNYPEQPYINPDRDPQWFKKLEIGTVTRVPLRNMQRTPENLLPGDIILLWRIDLGTFTNESIFPKYFEYDYGIDAPTRLQWLINENYAVVESALNSLEHVSGTEIKAILKQSGVSGYSKLKKDELVELVQETLTEEQISRYISIRGIHLTNKGKDALSNNPEVIDRHPKKNL
ncbi:hypothetical protein HZY88_02580 [Aerococcaceae bacterium DSM 111176]|nr:hypothetical protein [Aerococcaceae bacterium DSM 111176]